MTLILSCFTGLGVFDEGFRQEGFCVVSAGDIIVSSFHDVRNFHPPSSVFDGAIFGDPCQSHSALANLIRAKGLEPSFPDMTPEVKRVIEAAQPEWFLRENVPRAPDLAPEGYSVRSFVLDHSTMSDPHPDGLGTGHEQMRKRKFWFGVRGDQCPELRKFIDFALFVLPDTATAICAGHGGGDPNNPKFRGLQFRDGQRTRTRQVYAASGDAIIPGGQAEVDALKRGEIEKVARQKSVTGRHHSNGMGSAHPGNPPRYTLAEMLALQNLPTDLFDHSPLTMEGKKKLVGNALPLSMSKALAKAVKRAMGESR